MYNPFTIFSPKTIQQERVDHPLLSNAWLESIVSELTDAVIAYDEEFTVLVFNKIAEHIFHIPASRVLGTKLAIHHATEPDFQLLVQAMFTSLAPSVRQISEPGIYPHIVDLNFPDVDLRVTTNRIVDDRGVVQGFVKIIRDRTREAEIMRSKSEFLTVAAHQLRTPLSAVHWVFETLSKESLSQENMQLIMTGSLATQRLLKTVDDLLDIAKLEAGKFGYQFQEGDIVTFLDKLLLDAERVASAYHVRMYFEHAGITALLLTFDAQRLGVAIANLLDNAIKYNVPNGTVTVRLEKLMHEPYVLLIIQDTGVGVPPDAIHKLFTKFFRAENVVKFATEGSGLGLYLVKNIIMRHGGKISVESVLNRGTKFVIKLPTDPKLIPQKEIVIEE